MWVNSHKRLRYLLEALIETFVGKCVDADVDTRTGRHQTLQHLKNTFMTRDVTNAANPPFFVYFVFQIIYFPFCYHTIYNRQPCILLR